MSISDPVSSSLLTFSKTKRRRREPTLQVRSETSSETQMLFVRISFDIELLSNSWKSLHMTKAHRNHLAESHSFLLATFVFIKSVVGLWKRWVFAELSSLSLKIRPRLTNKLSSTPRESFKNSTLITLNERLSATNQQGTNVGLTMTKNYQNLTLFTFRQLYFKT